MEKDNNPMAIFSPSESPAIVVKEVDLTGGVPNVQSTTGAFAGNFRWGPVEKATLIDTEASLASTFGSPSNFEGTLSHQGALPPGPPAIVVISFSRKLSRTAFFSH